MFNYTITPSEDKTMIKHTWESNGYSLSIVALENKDHRIMVSNPMDAPSIYVDPFKEDKTVLVNWSALGNRGPAEAREYAEKIVQVSEVAEGFQQIIDAM